MSSELFASSSYTPEGSGLLRLSKSSFINYRMCPRKYWWNYWGLPDIRFPATEAMLRGTAIHQVYEDFNTEWESGKYSTAEDISNVFNNLPDLPNDPAIDAMIQIEQERMKVWEQFEPVLFEDKLEWLWEAEGVVLVGKPDAVFRHPDGGLCVVELKTGQLSSGKLGRVRKELCFYALLLEELGYGEVTHLCVFTPDCTNEKMLLSLINKRGKVVLNGEEQGLMLIEPIGKRTRTAFTKSLNDVVSGIKDAHWPMKWNDYFCTQFCDFNMSCDQQISTGEKEPWEC